MDVMYNIIIMHQKQTKLMKGIYMKQKNFKINIRIFVLILSLSISLVIGCYSDSTDDQQAGENEESHREEIWLKNHKFMMELAVTPEQWAYGLMGREFLSDDEGMIFVFPDREPFPTGMSFWMKDCLIPIDVLFLDRDGVIITIHEMEPPLPGTADHDLIKYPSYGPVQFAIEIRGGLAAELGLEDGDQVELRREFLLRLAE